MKCKIDNCGKKLWAYGYCSQHGQRFKLYGDPLYTKNERHGLQGTPEYRTWTHMRDRCNRPSDKSYSRYGGRGIKVCKKWNESFMEFYKDIGKKPTKKHQLERINNNGNYEPANCKWSTPIEQANNRRSNKLFTYNGQTQTLAQWARQYNINSDKLRQRVNRYKWSLDKALND